MDSGAQAKPESNYDMLGAGGKHGAEVDQERLRAHRNGLLELAELPSVKNDLHQFQKWIDRHYHLIMLVSMIIELVLLAYIAVKR